MVQNDFLFFSLRIEQKQTKATKSLVEVYSLPSIQYQIGKVFRATSSRLIEVDAVDVDRDEMICRPAGLIA